jgi:hypothetical protein
MINLRRAKANKAYEDFGFEIGKEQFRLDQLREEIKSIASNKSSEIARKDTQIQKTLLLFGESPKFAKVTRENIGQIITDTRARIKGQAGSEVKAIEEAKLAVYQKLAELDKFTQNIEAAASAQG